MKSLFPYKENKGLLEVDNEEFSKFQEEHGEDSMFLVVKGGDDLRKLKMHNLARMLGASRFYTFNDSSELKFSSVELFDYDKNMTNSLKYNGKVMTFTKKALEEQLGTSDSEALRKKSSMIVPSVAEKYGYGSVDGVYGKAITTKGISICSMLDTLVNSAFTMGAELDSNVIYAPVIKALQFKTSLVLEFYGK